MTPNANFQLRRGDMHPHVPPGYATGSVTNLKLAFGDSVLVILSLFLQRSVRVPQARPFTFQIFRHNDNCNKPILSNADIYM